MAWVVHKWIHMIDWPGQKETELLFVMLIIVPNEFMKQSSNHRVNCPVSLREPNRLTQQLNSGYSGQGKNRFGVPTKQGLGFFLFVGWWFVFFLSERGIWCHLWEQTGWEFFCAIPMWLFTLHQIYAPHTAYFRPNIRNSPDTQRCPVQQLCWQTTAFSIFSVSSHFGEGRGSLLKNIVYCLWTISLLPRQLSEVHLSHPKLQTQTNCPVEGFLVKATEH